MRYFSRFERPTIGRHKFVNHRLEVEGEVNEAQIEGSQLYRAGEIWRDHAVDPGPESPPVDPPTPPSSPPPSHDSDDSGGEPPWKAKPRPATMSKEELQQVLREHGVDPEPFSKPQLVGMATRLLKGDAKAARP